MDTHSDQPRAAYVHVPFCARRCGYCNFTLVAGRDDLIGPYFSALEAELELRRHPQPVDTLFIGGGTPTQLAPDQLERLLTLVARWYPLSTGGEWTIEANPEDLLPDTVALLAAGGVTRLSLGAQSFQPDKLRCLDRCHSLGDVLRAAAWAADHKLQLAIDLIFGAPGETIDHWAADLAQVIEIHPDHISTYGLTVERGTAFWSRVHHGTLVEVDEEVQLDMYEMAIDQLSAAGYEHYEVSNFAQPARRCRHNEVYWGGGSYDAVGPGAARYLHGSRETNHRSTTTYIRRMLRGESVVSFRECLLPEQRAREMLVFGLRRLEGVRHDEFADRTGFSLEVLGGAALQRHVAAGLLLDDGQRVKLTRAGLVLSDAIWPDLL